MSQAVAINVDRSTQTILVSGELTFATATSAMTEFNSLKEQVKELRIDLSDVTRSDSAGLALLVHWMRLAKATKKSLAFQYVPAQMLAIASASGLDELLPVLAD